MTAKVQEANVRTCVSDVQCGPQKSRESYMPVVYHASSLWCVVFSHSAPLFACPMPLGHATCKRKKEWRWKMVTKRCVTGIVCFSWYNAVRARNGRRVWRVDTPSVQALCGQFRGWACKTQFECCGDEDEALTNWVHRQGVGLISPASARPPVPIARCIHDAYNEAQSQGICTKCKSKVCVNCGEGCV